MYQIDSPRPGTCIFDSNFQDWTDDPFPRWDRCLIPEIRRMMSFPDFQRLMSFLNLLTLPPSQFQAFFPHLGALLRQENRPTPAR